MHAWFVHEAARRKDVQRLHALRTLYADASREADGSRATGILVGSGSARADYTTGCAMSVATPASTTSLGICHRDLKRVEAALMEGRELAAQLRQTARELHVHLDSLASAVASYRQARVSVRSGCSGAKEARAETEGCHVTGSNKHPRWAATSRFDFDALILSKLLVQANPAEARASRSAACSSRRSQSSNTSSSTSRASFIRPRSGSRDWSSRRRTSTGFGTSHSQGSDEQRQRHLDGREHVEFPEAGGHDERR